MGDVKTLKTVRGATLGVARINLGLRLCVKSPATMFADNVENDLRVGKCLTFAAGVVAAARAPHTGPWVVVSGDTGGSQRE